ncbi:hypothetical protein J7K27_10115 [Candidatus Bathyarchaeota archaeon]|nr:hypothetical protein [Candidatus Bathyarchaeota archaeon]
MVEVELTELTSKILEAYNIPVEDVLLCFLLRNLEGEALSNAALEHLQSLKVKKNA